MTLDIRLHRRGNQEGNKSQQDTHFSELVYAMPVQLGLFIKTTIRRRRFKILQHPGVSKGVENHQHEYELFEAEQYGPAVAGDKPQDVALMDHHDYAGNQDRPDAHPYECNEPPTDPALDRARCVIFRLKDWHRYRTLKHHSPKPNDNAKNMHAATNPDDKIQRRSSKYYGGHREYRLVTGLNINHFGA